MKSRVIALSIIFILMLLPFSHAAPADLQKEIVKAADVGSKYSSGSISYTEAIIEINEIKEASNAILKKEALEKKDIEEALGQPTSETNWVRIEGEENQVQLADPASEWNDIIFDGSDSVQLRSSVKPVVSDEQVSYELDFSLEFKEDQPALNIKEEIANIKTLAETFRLNSKDIEVLNDLAERTTAVERLFNEYTEQSPDSCQDIMADVLGNENKVSEQNIVIQEFTVHSARATRIKIILERCDNCINANWINLRFSFEDSERPLRFIESRSIPEAEFREMDSNELKRTLIDYFGTFQTLADSGSYQAAYDVSKRIEKVSEIWDEKSRQGSQTEQQLNFADEKNFYLSLFEGSPVINSYSEQVTYEQILVQELEEEKGEMCENKIDDNEDGKIDCQDSLCNGQLCGYDTIITTENNLTINTTIELFCIAGICQAKEEEKNQDVSTCGNYICEEGEEASCSGDCVVCPTYPPIECSGDVISQGIDSNGCHLPPICVPKTNSCTSSAGCEQPLCGLSECIQGECVTQSINECRQPKCTDGEEKIQKCGNGQTIITEICSNSVWKMTGAECAVSITAPEIAIREVSTSVCKVAGDCGEGYNCNLGICEPKVYSTNPVSPVSSNSASKGFKGITTTGQVVSITGEGITGTGITGVVPEADVEKFPDALTTAKDYQIQRSTENRGRSSPLTGIVSPSEEGEIEVAVTITTPTGQTTSLRPIIDSEKEVFVVRGVSSISKGKENCMLAFGGGGKSGAFETVVALQDKYRKDTPPTYADYNLENRIKERQEFEKSFTPEFAKSLFENRLANDASNWESMADNIFALDEKNIENLAEMARMMDSLGIERLDPESYNLINFKYESPLGKLEYNEVKDTVFLSGMRSPVEIISPSIKLELYASEDFVRSELRKAKLNNEFIGSVGSQAKREAENGLTREEKVAIINNPELMELITKLSESYGDKTLDVQLMIVDGEDVLYNVYARINPEYIVKAEPMSEEIIPPVDARVIVPFSEAYKLIESSRRIAFTRYAPWDKSFKFSSIITSTMDWFTIKRQTSALMNSVKIEGNNEKDIKKLFEEIFFEIGEQGTAKKMQNSVVTEDSPVIWNEEGSRYIA